MKPKKSPGMALPKRIKEEMNTTGNVRGLGYVTGNPMVDGDFQMQWTMLNQSDADTRDQIINQTKKTVHDELHLNIEQKRQEQKQNFIQNVLSSIKDRNIENR